MQITKIIKYTIPILIIISINFSAFAQENDKNNRFSDTLTTQSDTIKPKHKFSLSNLFKRKNKDKEDDFENETDTISPKKKKFSFKNLFKRRHKQDTVISESDSLSGDSANQQKKFSLFKKNKNDTTNKGKLSKPDRITLKTWLNLNALQQDSLLRAWDDYDREFYIKKYQPNERERKRAMKRNKNFIDKLLLKKAANKPYLYRKKLINRRIARYRKTMKFDRLKKSQTTPDDSLTDKQRYRTVNKKFKREAKQEAIRKNKVILKYDKKEQRLKNRYALSENEKQLLHKGTAMRLKGADKLIFNKAKRKQEKFTQKLLKLRQKRSYALQNKEVQKRMKENKKQIARRDRLANKKLTKKKKSKENNKKFDSSEYPKKWFK